jgi:hypothetical protein
MSRLQRHNTNAAMSIAHSDGRSRTAQAYTTGVPLTKFFLFTKLPLELQFKVQKINMSTARRVDIDFKKREEVNRKIGSSTEVPANLQVCGQWRHEAL